LLPDACRDEIELKFDRPFVFAVVHGPTSLALFAGEVYKPEAWKA
jgi:serpin B